MSYRVLIIFLSILYSSSADSNSIYTLNNNAQTSSLGGLHILSNDINGLFNQPIDLNSQKLRGNSYYSYSSHFNNIFDIFQFGYCIRHDNEGNISFGIIKKSIKNNYKTNNSWLFNSGGPSFSEIDYSSISTFSDHEIGFLISISNKLSYSSSINFKVKPSIHTIDNNIAYGLAYDIIYFRKINKIDFILGVEDLFSLKKWENGENERYNLKAFSNVSFNFKKLLFSLELNQDLHSVYGLDYYISEFLSIRCGYNKLNDLTFGFGLRTEVFKFDYAYVNIENDFINNINQYAITLNLEGLKKLYKNIGI